MPKFSVRVKRIDVYTSNLEVEAGSAAEAEVKVNKMIEADGWAGPFPDNEDGDYQSCDSEVDSVTPVSDTRR